MLKVGAQYLHRRTILWIFWARLCSLLCRGRRPDEWKPPSSPPCSGPLSRCLVVWLKADVTWNFVAVALGMVAFGLFALPPLISRSGYE